jgi:hypothetical protein
MLGGAAPTIGVNMELEGCMYRYVIKLDYRKTK